MPKLSQENASFSQASSRFDRRTVAIALAGSLLCYLAHPPVGWSWLAWIGPAAWCLLARVPKLRGRRPYAAIWLAGAVYWLLTIQWIRLPHWANIFGLFFLAAYLGAYLPAFVGLTRVAVHRMRLPLWLAAPIAWTGLEWIRARLLTGFLMGSLAHTQVNFPQVIQIADIFGEYGVTFLIVLVAAAIAAALPHRWIAFFSSEGEPGGLSPRSWQRPLPLIPAAVALIATLAYGQWRIDRLDEVRNDARHVTVALIQSDMLADWKGTAERDIAVMKQMIDLSQQAVRESKQKVDLVVWPETMYRDQLHMSEGDYRPPQELFQGSVEEIFTATTNFLGSFARDLDAAVLVGLDRVLWRKPADDAEPLVPGVPPFEEESFNSSAMIDRTGRLAGTYDKMHLLPFGEYTPLSDWIPLLRSISPITGLASPGRGPSAIEVDGVAYVPDICYETVLSQLIRRQIADLIDAGKHPDVMVNLTNDAWYWGSSELDMHLASGVFRAVEMRLPLVVAANRGLSAHVDNCGRIIAVTERNVPAKLVTSVTLPQYESGEYPSLFAAYGDWFALACLVCCIVPAAVACRDRRRPPLAA